MYRIGDQSGKLAVLCKRGFTDPHSTVKVSEQHWRLEYPGNPAQLEFLNNMEPWFYNIRDFALASK